MPRSLARLPQQSVAVGDDDHDFSWPANRASIKRRSNWSSARVEANGPLSEYRVRWQRLSTNTDLGAECSVYGSNGDRDIEAMRSARFSCS